MKEQVLKQMIAVTDEVMKFCKTEFYKWDLKELTQMDEQAPFLWSVREAATTLLSIDAEHYMKRINESEGFRFTFMHSPYVYVDNFATTSKWGGRSFYYNGNELQEIPIDKAGNFAKDVFSPVIEKLKAYVNDSFAKKDGDYEAKLPIRFSCKDTWLKALHLAKTSEGEKLLTILRSKRNMCRVAKDQYVLIGNDFDEKSFTFGEYVNDECVLNGGILYYNEGWHSHT